MLSLCLRLRNATLPVQLHLHQVQASHIVASANAKQANLSASRIQRVELPVYDDTSKGRQAYHISHFLSHPSGIQAILNTSALQNFQYLDTNAYRSTSFLPCLILILLLLLFICHHHSCSSSSTTVPPHCCLGKT